MPTSVIGLFETQDIARKVVSALGKAGFDDDKIETLTKIGVGEVTDRLVEAGYEKDKASRYGEALQKGGVLIVADVEDDKADEALSTMRRFDVLTPEALLESAGEETSAQVIEESLEVGKTKVSAGKRLKTEVSEREVEETVTLHDESVEVERTKVGKALKPGEAADAFKETSVEVSGYHRKAGGFQGSPRGRGSQPEQELRRARRYRQRDRPPSGRHGRGRRSKGEKLQEVLTPGQDDESGRTPAGVLPPIRPSEQPAIHLKQDCHHGSHRDEADSLRVDGGGGTAACRAAVVRPVCIG